MNMLFTLYLGKLLLLYWSNYMYYISEQICALSYQIEVLYLKLLFSKRELRTKAVSPST